MDTPENSDESEKMRKKKGVRLGRIKKLWPGRMAGKKEIGFQVCFLPPASPDSAGASTVATKNRVGKDERLEEFGSEFLKALIEKNDFYSKDCNVHVDV